MEPKIQTAISEDNLFAIPDLIEQHRVEVYATATQMSDIISDDMADSLIEFSINYIDPYELFNVLLAASPDSKSLPKSIRNGDLTSTDIIVDIQSLKAESLAALLEFCIYDQRSAAIAAPVVVAIMQRFATLLNKPDNANRGYRQLFAAITYSIAAHDIMLYQSRISQQTITIANLAIENNLLQGADEAYSCSLIMEPSPDNGTNIIVNNLYLDEDTFEDFLYGDDDDN